MVVIKNKRTLGRVSIERCAIIQTNREKTKYRRSKSRKLQRAQQLEALSHASKATQLYNIKGQGLRPKKIHLVKSSAVAP